MSGVPYSRILRTFVRQNVSSVPDGIPRPKYYLEVIFAHETMDLFVRSTSTSFLNPPIVTTIPRYLDSFLTKIDRPDSIIGCAKDLGIFTTIVHLVGFHSRQLSVAHFLHMSRRSCKSSGYRPTSITSSAKILSGSATLVPYGFLYSPTASMKSPDKSSMKTRNSAGDSVTLWEIPFVGSATVCVRSLAVRINNSKMNAMSLLKRFSGILCARSSSKRSLFITRSYALPKSRTASSCPISDSATTNISNAAYNMFRLLWNPN